MSVATLQLLSLVDDIFECANFVKLTLSQLIGNWRRSMILFVFLLNIIKSKIEL